MKKHPNTPKQNKEWKKEKRKDNGNTIQIIKIKIKKKKWKRDSMNPHYYKTSNIHCM